MLKPFKVLSSQVWQSSLALGSGLVMGLAAVPSNEWGLGWIAMVPLWLGLTLPRSPVTHPLRYWQAPAFYLPLLWGLGFYGYTLIWITGLHPLMWLGVPWLASIAIALFCWAFITFWGAALPVIWVALLRWLQRRTGLAAGGRIFVGANLWAALEIIWSQGPLAWTNLAFTQTPGNVVILHLGQLAGPWIISLAIAAVNGLLAEALQQQFGRSVNPRPKRLGAIALALFASLHLVGYVLYQRPLIDAPENQLRIGVIQGNVPTRIKLTDEGIRRAETGYTQGYVDLANTGMQAVLTPEGALPFIWNAPAFAKTPFYQAILQKQVPLWLGTFYPEPDGLARSLITLSAQGEVLSRYDKIKLVPLGEYTPFASVLGGLINQLSPVQENGKPGTLNQQFDTPLGRAIAGICYDSVFPNVFQRQAKAGGKFILTSANLDPYSERLMVQFEALEVMRAIETDRWLVRATNTGYSGVINPKGKVIWRSQPFTYQIYPANLYSRATKTLYVVSGDIPILFTISLLTLGYLLFWVRSQKTAERPSAWVDHNP
ncbi:MAG TPA: apolipoprotein N-acyltransferase [Leptolyngbyaceae cyanobacterium M33_DOE_097]|uniref:Apolipoprotein N-acyltransferase n=1 Tax=Oscillatoriales cyanobacterium SpSt-418 TaxID=2282169 RepID=A0A7C3KFV7_9CYAN|nr:apolipoprotein N-acyltransferase [Leptolyngbyaceae cyanobacterium M33_DOE_097]